MKRLILLLCLCVPLSGCAVRNTAENAAETAWRQTDITSLRADLRTAVSFEAARIPLPEELYLNAEGSPAHFTNRCAPAGDGAVRLADTDG